MMSRRLWARGDGSLSAGALLGRGDLLPMRGGWSPFQDSGVDRRRLLLMRGDGPWFMVCMQDLVVCSLLMRGSPQRVRQGCAVRRFFPVPVGAGRVSSGSDLRTHRGTDHELSVGARGGIEVNRGHWPETGLLPARGMARW